MRQRAVRKRTGALLLLGTSGLALTLLLGQSHSADVPVESPEQLFQRGSFEEAAQQWQALAESHAQARRPLQRSDALVALAQAYLALGHYTKAAQQLELALALLHPLNDRVREATVLGALGHVYLVAGQRDAAESYLHDALSLARELKDPGRTAVLLNNLGTLHAWQQQDEEALKQFTESRALAETAKLPLVAVQAMLNAGKASLRLKVQAALKEEPPRAFLRPDEVAEARSSMDQAAQRLRALPSSHDKAYGLITLGLGYADLGGRIPGERDRLLPLAALVLEEAGEVGKAIGDKRAASYAFGFRGRLYEQAGRVEDALLLTRHAVAYAQEVNAAESLYRWEWQTGRLLTQQGKLKDAIAAYERAVEIIKTIRPEMTAGAGGVGGSFRESAGAVFVELADLYLRSTDKTNSYLVQARDAIELSKAAELRDYFHDDCVDLLRARMTRLPDVSKTAAVIYPILLPDRTELLVDLPDGLHRVTVPVGAERLTREVRQLRRFLEKRTTQQYLGPARQLYDWLIRPLEPSFKMFPLDTLVIVPDGPLRTIPMAALHDGRDFLIRKYAVATTPGLTLTDARPLRREGAKVLGAGLTVAVQGFSALPYVESELGELEKLYGSRTLVNDAFRSAALEQELRDTRFAVVHVASHAKFESRAQDTFLLTFDGRVTMDELNALIGVFRFRDDPLELLTLSACETAAGDDRAALGLAGVAIKAGARSALATLWFVSDVATSELVAEFYRQLRNPALSKAQALQRAQLMMLDDPVGRHPGYWAPFLLISNWL